MTSQIPPEKWERSKAKAVLKQLLKSDDLYMNMHKEHLYLLSPELFGQYRKDYFVEKVEDLKATIKENKKQNKLQEKALVADRVKFPKNPITFWGYRRWDDSEAKRQLREDIKNGLQKTMKPEQLRTSKMNVYGEFPLAIFRKHIYQEEYAQVGRSYWMNKKEETKKKKENKAKRNQDPLWKKTVEELRNDLRALGLKVSGKKEELIQRLRNHNIPSHNN